MQRINTDDQKDRFQFALNFYPKEQGAKRKIIKFSCDEEKPPNQDDQYMQKKSETKEFAFVHVFERMLQVYWQEFFEKNLGIQGKVKVDEAPFEDCYQYHAFVLKKNSYFMMQRRFMVLTQLWMFNVDADLYNKKTGMPEFKKMKWKVPLESIITATLSMTDDRVTITLYTDKRKQNDMLVAHGGKRINKDKRKLQFSDAISARDFLYNVIRLNF